MQRNLWDERYAKDGYMYGIRPNDFLQSVSDQIPGTDVLCIADGEGRNGVFLAEQGFAVTSMDGSEVGVQKARALADERGVQMEVLHDDLSAYDLGDGRWDAIISIFAHVPPEIRRDVHARIPRALRPGGLLVLEAYTPAQLQYGTGGPPIAELMMSLAGLRSEIMGLEFERGEELVREVVEGRGHWGTSAVVQVLARRSRDRA